MRRAEFLVEDEEFIKEILQNCEYGVVSLVYDKLPYSVPLNFVYFEKNVYFHGAKGGKKIQAIKENPHASFVAVEPYSLIPSYFSDSPLACPATQFFASVFMEGKIEFVEDVNDKADVFNAFMQKLQSDGGYEPISPNENYLKMLKATALLKLVVSTKSCKVKVGQNLSSKKLDKLIEKLEKRDSLEDRRTIKMMQLFRKSI